MDEKEDISGSITVISDDRIDSLCPIIFGVSCAFFALRLLKKLECTQKHVVELKKRRTEEAKANAKVVSIFAAREQSWFDERRQLRQQIDALVNEVKLVQTNRDECVNELQMKKNLIEEMDNRRREAEEKAEDLSEELKLYVSNHHGVETEIERAIRQVEAAKREVESAKKMLSMDLVRIRKDLDRKDWIFSALLRKSKADRMFLQGVYSTATENGRRSIKNTTPKFEGFRCRVTRMELESKRFRERIKGLDPDVDLLRRDKKRVSRRKTRDPDTTHDIVFTIESPIKEIKAGTTSNSASNMDIHSLGVSYKIKRLKQQLSILGANSSSIEKQVDRYESIQSKMDGLYRRMHVDDDDGGGRAIGMEQFLEETFEVQRYIVSTGQKLQELQGEIASGFPDMKQFGDSISGLVREVQRGLELQVSRIIRDLLY
ncbi:uncharacterized protein LOC127244886 isoform X1 [Andrographis paniculata]|uniref:uncharacterized protein LOC127244886 isoform X1 n=1 Tax=Andrographis paniculata TaxID=175694 RepID=UPI0021E79783|nr:uncharacterized protein LOC127244886 isoform X1 [Andrographis paniculata]